MSRCKHRGCEWDAVRKDECRYHLYGDRIPFRCIKSNGFAPGTHRPGQRCRNEVTAKGAVCWKHKGG